MNLLKNWKIHVLTLLITLIAEYIGIQKHQVNGILTIIVLINYLALLFPFLS